MKAKQKKAALRYGKPHKFAVGAVGGTMTEYRTRVALQCRGADRLFDCWCQGAEGHVGQCWAYSPSGWLYQWKRRKDIKSRFDIASSQTPPGHKLYIDPAKKSLECYRLFVIREKVREYQDDWDEPKPARKRKPATT